MSTKETDFIPATWFKPFGTSYKLGMLVLFVGLISAVGLGMLVDNMFFLIMIPTLGFVIWIEWGYGKKGFKRYLYDTFPTLNGDKPRP